jgi:hypothetical protein
VKISRLAGRVGRGDATGPAERSSAHNILAGDPRMGSRVDVDGFHFVCSIIEPDQVSMPLEHWRFWGGNDVRPGSFPLSLAGARPGIR